MGSSGRRDHPSSSMAAAAAAAASGGGPGHPHQPVAPSGTLPLCPQDKDCPHINDRAHQSEFAHTCRLFPCFHAHIPFHTYHFHHLPGQAAAPSEDGSSQHGGSQVSFNKGGSNKNDGENSDSVGANSKSSSRRSRGRANRKAVQRATQSSSSFAMLSPEAPNATKITVIQGGNAYEVHGDWSRVRVHTFKRYLHQVCGIRPVDQQLLRDSVHELKDDLKYMADENIREGTQIVVRNLSGEAPVTGEGTAAAAAVASGSGAAGSGGSSASAAPSGATQGVLNVVQAPSGPAVAAAATAAAQKKTPKVPIDWL